MDDLINRTAAIVDLDKYAATLNPDKDNKELWKVNSIKQFIKQFPSALPVAKDIDVLSTDTISRQAVLDAFMRTSYIAAEDRLISVAVIKALPTTHPQQMRGRWIEEEDYNGDTIYECSECGNEFVLIDGTPKDNNYFFCPSCGAKMDRGEQNETD